MSSYDEKCQELAEHFLSDKPGLDPEQYDASVAKLALRIQQTIEEFIAELPQELA